MPSPREQGIERMGERARQRPVRLLAASLAALDARPELDEAERLTRGVLMDVICEREPAAEAAFEAWAQSNDYDLRHGSGAIIAAGRKSVR
jgi:hypothetical protein